MTSRFVIRSSYGIDSIGLIQRAGEQELEDVTGHIFRYWWGSEVVGDGARTASRGMGLLSRF